MSTTVSILEITACPDALDRQIIGQAGSSTNNARTNDRHVFQHTITKFVLFMLCDYVDQYMLCDYVDQYMLCDYVDQYMLCDYVDQYMLCDYVDQFMLCDYVDQYMLCDYVDQYMLCDYVDQYTGPTTFEWIHQLYKVVGLTDHQLFSSGVEH